MTEPSPKRELLDLFREAVAKGTLAKLTLSSPSGADATLKNVFVRALLLRAGPRLSFLYRHATRDITKNLSHEEGVARVAELLGTTFRSAHLFTSEATVELELRDGQPPRLVVGKPSEAALSTTGHDRPRKRFIEAKGTAWLHALGVTNSAGVVREGLAAKWRQINKFVEILHHSLADLPSPETRPLSLMDMGCGKGYLTFAAFDYLRRSGWSPVEVRGIEARAELVDLCNRVARESGFEGLRFECGTIESTPVERTDVLVTLHACDTATDDAIAKGIQAGARLILVAPCCHKELRPQLRPPPVLAGALKHGILRERQAEFVTDALRAGLLEWAGYDSKVFEFISHERHVAENLMIAAVKHPRGSGGEAQTRQVRELAAFFGVRSQRLAQRLGFSLRPGPGQTA